jgi:prefoldin subunit 5
VDIVYLVETFGFEVVMIIGLGYFVFFVWQTITKTINPALVSMKATIIRLTDQLRLLDQDMIRLQQKVNTVTELKEEGKLNEEALNTSNTKSDTNK